MSASAHRRCAAAVLTDDHPLAKRSCEEPSQAVAHRVVYRQLQAKAVGARDPVAPIDADSLPSAIRRRTRAAVVGAGGANQQVGGQGNGVVRRVVELEGAAGGGVGRRRRDAAEP